MLFDVGCLHSICFKEVFVDIELQNIPNIDALLYINEVFLHLEYLNQA